MYRSPQERQERQVPAGCSMWSCMPTVVSLKSSAVGFTRIVAPGARDAGVPPAAERPGVAWYPGGLAEQIAPVLELPAEYRLATLTEHIASVDVLLRRRRFGGAPEAAQLRDRIAEFTQAGQE